jgi:hypothetical protein
MIKINERTYFLSLEKSPTSSRVVLYRLDGGVDDKQYVHTFTSNDLKSLPVLLAGIIEGMTTPEES